MTRGTPALRRCERGQASLELVATVPAMVLGGMIALQLAITGYTLHLADGAAEAAALAAAAGTDPESAAVAALPGWASDRVDVSVDDGRVEVAVRPPAPHPQISSALEVSAAAWTRSADDG
jgi:hypothetical protein